MCLVAGHVCTLRQMQCQLNSQIHHNIKHRYCHDISSELCKAVTKTETHLRTCGHHVCVCVCTLLPSAMLAELTNPS